MSKIPRLFTIILLSLNFLFCAVMVIAPLIYEFDKEHKRKPITYLEWPEEPAKIADMPPYIDFNDRDLLTCKILFALINRDRQEKRNGN